ncbi:MAG TPA: lipopolysaccharide heptosyltransferase family protein [Piscirickettsiaceae bacterium]|nr:lipopolysaccharide heptosyltransferase family protein [Piscirickettsiaceae bacterium]
MLSFNKTYTLPFKFSIPNYTQDFLDQTSVFKRWTKFFKRYLYIVFKGQKNLEVFSILPTHKNILWINISAPSLGDSLMDLSSRIMLKGRNVDLFTDKKNAHIYMDDHIFVNIYTELADINDSKYDLVIVDSYSSRSINIKSKIAQTTRFFGMFGYYNGPEVNRVLFSFHQMNHLLGYVRSEDEVNASAKASMSISKEDQEIVKQISLPDNYIAIVLGGEWDYRTYNNWGKVIGQILASDKQTNFVFIGSANAKDKAKEFLNQFSEANIFNCVAKYSFNQTAQIIQKAKILLCCDGGLMHAANAVATPIVPLFARLTSKMQLTDVITAFPLFDKEDVNNIPVNDVLGEYYKASNYVDNHPQGE